MNEKPILFSGKMVRQILRGRKTQTRRVIKPQPPHWRWNDHSWDDRCIDVGTGERDDAYYVICPYGKPGDRLWVRETWAHDDPSCKDVRCGNRDHIWWKATEKKIVADSFAGDAHWRPSIHMPRWASRLTLEIVNVRVERVQEITPANCKAEGIYIPHPTPPITTDEALKHLGEYKNGFALLWDSINSKRGYSWDANPWVWVVEFKRVTK